MENITCTTVTERLGTDKQIEIEDKLGDGMSITVKVYRRECRLPTRIHTF